ncbi:Autophagy-related protein 16 [Penicillium coprophilum]|uniref:Autophagy-related protein 16 n=1 Tax=Penicillium coprophilum TaxID=36646 RepID=UPI0023855D2D|nr:Autophagy-related protein 16 [Penicillium coprophilum]KAJ5177856.1 Autophagy-related protein 16 [Penicillium coprophilum]
MAHWREEYLAALTVRDNREKANAPLYAAYAQLADRTSNLEITAKCASPATAQSEAQSTVPSPIVPLSKKQRPAEPGFPPTDLLNATRADLSEAQRLRSELQDRLNRVNTEVETLRKKSSQEGRRINALESERAHLKLRLQDRDAELKGKAKLLEDFQDELATLNLQLNMTEERSTRLKNENQDLVDRWMARMGQEAEAMNDASKYS